MPDQHKLAVTGKRADEEGERVSSVTQSSNSRTCIKGLRARTAAGGRFDARPGGVCGGATVAVGGATSGVV